jgi:Mn-containing catalase
MFMKALDAMGKLDDPMFGTIPPDDTVKLVFNLSQGEDVRSPWNEVPDFEYIADPAPKEGCLPPRSTQTMSVLFPQRRRQKPVEGYRQYRQGSDKTSASGPYCKMQPWSEAKNTLVLKDAVSSVSRTTRQWLSNFFQ